MSDKLNILQKKINIKFKNLNYLKKSITHKSYDPENNYEKFEFLGDRILGFVISKKLIELYPNEKEGVLDKKLASLVNKNKCLDVAKIIGLEVHAGHGITFASAKILSRIKGIQEFNIGHFLIGESIFVGLNKTIKNFRKIVK